MDRDVRDLAKKKLESQNRIGTGEKVALIATLGTVAALTPLIGLKLLGFSGAGIAPGSWAAAWQPPAISSQGWFAWAQTTAATGAAFPKLGMVTSGATWLGLSQPAPDMTDEELLMKLLEKNLIDYEIRNLFLQKLRSKDRK